MDKQKFGENDLKSHSEMLPRCFKPDP